MTQRFTSHPGVLLPAAVLFFLMTSAALAQRDLPTQRSTLFTGSGNCQMCHGPGSTANVTAAGEDVSPPTNWRSTMMANAARDPFWQAQVIAESRDLPALAGVIQDKCTNCHVPMGHEEAHRSGDTEYTLDEALPDKLFMDGVSCTLCHQVLEDNFGTPESFSGGYEISDQKVSYGPYPNPIAQAMINMTGYTPLFSAHIERSEHCATCHTLYTPYVDAAGNIAGEFPEQTPYLEWKASMYPAQNTSCQTCHMPALQEGIRISSIPPAAGPRSPYFQHHFVGGNTFMLGVIKAHADEIGATALDADFDRTILRTRTQLQQTSVQLSGAAELQGSELRVAVTLDNLAGHKFPSGIPTRRAWLHVTVKDAQDRTVFESGDWDADGEILSYDDGYEPHYDVITAAGQVQVYEAVMADTDGEVTARLLRAARYLKDNRLPPRGFAAGMMNDPDIGVKGAAAEDADFNNIDGSGGTGGDVVHYRLGVDPAAGPFTIEVDLCYQAIKPLFIENLERHDEDPVVDRMLGYVENAGESVEVMQSITLSGAVGVAPIPDASVFAALQCYPQPVSLSAGGDVLLAWQLQRTVRDLRVALYAADGREIASWTLGERAAGHHRFRLPVLPLAPGMYFAVLRVEKEQIAAPLAVLP